jgi:Icc-related predicted phosphoesterase
MKIICISDTHGQHQQLKLPIGDVLIHAGDISGRGRDYEIISFINWFSNQPHPNKIFIAGNHDFYFEKEKDETIRKLIPENIIYLNDSGITIDGINFWGSPITPWFYDWAFNRQRGADIRKHWEKIPENTDILITHGPPFGILDETTRGEKVGCKDILPFIENIKPKLYVFGHIHEAYGIKKIDEIIFVNASVLNEGYEMVNEAVVVEV